MLAFEFDPVTAAPRYIGRPQAFADEAFHLHLAGAIEQGFRVFAKGVGEAQQWVFAGFEHGRERRPALLDGHFAQVHSIEIGQIKQVVEDIPTAARFEDILQSLEVRNALLVGHHHFAVQPGRFQAQPRQRLGLVGQLVGPVVAVASEELDLVMVDTRHDAVAVELQ